MSNSRPVAAIVGSGNIGTDLMAKLLPSKQIDLRYMVGIDPDSPGLHRAAELGLETSSEGVAWLLDQPRQPEMVFEATSAHAHAANAPKYEDAGIVAIDLTPAAVGQFVVPVVNLPAHLGGANFNLITCGGQATIPIVAAVSRVADVPYAEIVSSVASHSAGPGTRANIDEFTQATARGLEVIGGAKTGKAIVILNPSEPPMLMRNTVFCATPAGADTKAIESSIDDMVSEVASYVPGYRLKAAPQFDDPRDDWRGMGRVAVFLEVEGSGDYLPRFAGNLDIMTSAAVRVGERLAADRFEVGE